jgi:branched-subunit amino acid transport protein
MNGMGPSDAYLWIAILAITLSALLTRAGLLLWGTGLQFRPVVQSALRYAPACALAAILVPDLVFVDQQLWLAPSNPKLLAGLASCLIFAFFRSMIGSLIGGMAVYWVVGYLFAG